MISTPTSRKVELKADLCLLFGNLLAFVVCLGGGRDG